MIVAIAQPAAAGLVEIACSMSVGNDASAILISVWQRRAKDGCCEALR
jgi:hypothetical protein